MYPTMCSFVSGVSSLVIVLLFTVADAQYDYRREACINPVEACPPDKEQFPEGSRIEFQYAKTIRNLKYGNDHVTFEVSVVDSDGKETIPQFKLVKCGCPPGNTDGLKVLYTNPKKVYVDEGPIFGLLDVTFDDLDRIKYVNDVSYIYNKNIRGLVKSSEIIEISDDGSSPDFSTLTKDPDVGLSLLGSFAFLKYNPEEVEVPSVAFAEKDESTALGRAEWMKLVGLIFDQPAKANEQFEKVVNSYEDVKKSAAKAERRPSVFFNAPFENLWTQPSQDTYIVGFINDANADYRYASRNSSETENLDFSQIEEDFRSAQFLLNASVFPLGETRDLDGFIESIYVVGPSRPSKDLPRSLHSVQCGHVWYTDRKSTDGASDFFESAIFRPHLVLQDYVKILHPYIDIEEDFFYMGRYRNSTSDDVDTECPYDVVGGEPPEGEVVAEQDFTVPNYDRFEIEDRVENGLIRGLKDKIPSEKVELIFKNTEIGEKETTVTVRTFVKEDEVSEFYDSDDVLAAMRSSLGDNVSAKPVPTPEPPSGEDPVPPDGEKEDGGGLSGGAIFGIVIAVLVVVAIIAFLWYRNRKGAVLGGRQRLHAGNGSMSHDGLGQGGNVAVDDDSPFV